MTGVIFRDRPHDTDDELLDNVAEKLNSNRDDLISRQVTVAWSEHPHYKAAGVPITSIETSAHGILDNVMTTLIQRRVPTPDDFNEAWLARTRADQGVTVTDMLNGYRSKHRVIREAFLFEAQDVGASFQAVSSGLTLLIGVSDLGAAQLLTTRRELDVENRSDRLSEVEVVQSLVAGNMSEPSIRDAMSSHGLKPEQAYYVVRGRPHSAIDAMQFRNEVQANSWQGTHSGLVVVIDDEVVGLVPRCPDAATGGLIGVGPQCIATEAAQSYACASRVLATAERFGMSGTVTTDDLGLRLAVAAESELGHLLRYRYFGPLESVGSFGATLRYTVGEYLQCGGETKRAARSLNVHPNTLKYRLQRFQQLTGADLTDPKTIAELWWVIEAQLIR